ncbi:MAG: hypothetical protein HETSPECPRED_007963 [Heterodermia speciosa]|uniref:Uncharacterized protein n=1 Tax=Heterodermia speciosa TaxID=116794 RepID=A0A8H3EJU3_9LECA|nr:MAG: hypothetical protein HETSPECPRED_007963 [Heterodermia speciosa]
MQTPNPSTAKQTNRVPEQNQADRASISTSASDLKSGNREEVPASRCDKEGACREQDGDSSGRRGTGDGGGEKEKGDGKGVTSEEKKAREWEEVGGRMFLFSLF